MLGLSKWGSSDRRVDSDDTITLRNWEIHSIPGYVANIREGERIGRSLEICEHPPINMFKLNFDEASKGNPGSTGFGGAIIDSEGNMVGLYWGYISENSNNVAELKGFLVGLVMAAQYGWFPIILEGDSQIILQMATTLLHGKMMNKVVDNWKMAHSLELLRNLL